MKACSLRIYTLIGFIILFSFEILESQDSKYIPDPEDALGLLDDAILNNEVIKLDQICSDEFLASEVYQFIRSNVLEKNNKLNVNFRTASIAKEFIIQGKERERLVIILDQTAEKNWIVQDAYLKGDSTNSPISGAAFAPLAYADYFRELKDVIKQKDITYFGLGPGGKLNFEQIDSLQLELSNKTLFTYKNIILHNSKAPIAFLYLTFKEFSCNDRTNCGWLLDEAGFLKDLYLDNPFLSYLLDKSSNEDLNKKNEIDRSIKLSPFIEILEPTDMLIPYSLKTSQASASVNSFSDNYGAYIVQKGDCLWSIAIQHGTTINKLKKINKLNSNLILVNQRLKLPRLQ